MSVCGSSPGELRWPGRALDAAAGGDGSAGR